MVSGGLPPAMDRGVDGNVQEVLVPYGGLFQVLGRGVYVPLPLAVRFTWVATVLDIVCSDRSDNPV